MAKADLEMALVKSQGRSPLTPDELLELMDVDIGQLITSHDMDLYQAEEVMMWRKHEALRYSAHIVSYPPAPLEESRKISKHQLDKMILGSKRKVIKESQPHHQFKPSNTPTGLVEVEWDFETDDPEWMALSYEEQAAQEGLNTPIKIPEWLMKEYAIAMASYGEEQAGDLITDWLSDETGWLHQGWSWV